MKRIQLLALVAAILVVTSIGYSRLTGTNPTGSSADTFCVGKKSYEWCVDYAGNALPTTTNNQTSGTSSLRWSNVYTTLLNVSGASTLTGAVTASAGITVSTLTVTASASPASSSVACTTGTYATDNTSLFFCVGGFWKKLGVSGTTILWTTY